jgi:K+-transporting ATPase KdpF subunit
LTLTDGLMLALSIAIFAYLIWALLEPERLG